jgi:hypothetical protein
VPGWMMMAQLSGGGVYLRREAVARRPRVDPRSRLVRADAATFCVEAGEQTWLYHLDGSAQEDNSWNWGAVKGACPA